MLDRKKEVPLPALYRIRDAEKPLVSVIIPCYGKCDQVLLQRAVDSVNAQTYKNIETLIITEADNPPEARNKGIYASTGKYIAFLDADDEWDNTKIAMQVEYMEAHPECGLCITWSRDDRFGMIRACMPKSDPTFHDLIRSFNLSSTSSYMIRNNGMHYFDTDLKSGQEYDLAMDISAYNKIHTIPRILTHQHATPGQISTNWKKKIQGQFTLYKKWHKLMPPFSHLKTLGLMFMFTMGYVFGNKIYKVLIPIKEMYEWQN